MAFDYVLGRGGVFGARYECDFSNGRHGRGFACNALCVRSRAFNPSRDSTAYCWRTFPACHASIH
ncbi:MAG: hypothetical protein AB8A41_04535 [Prochlorococcus sp.]